MLSLARFFRSFLRNSGAGLRQEEVEIPLDGGSIPATLYRPAHRAGVPGWVVLHGITVAGRSHVSLVRLARALSAAGGAVLVPEIDTWRRLVVDPEATAAVLGASAAFLDERGDTGGGVTVMGFSFGATQALVTAADPRHRGHISGVVGFGGYCDLRRTVLYMMTGRHDWRGKQYRLDPDPYGRWIVAANYLTHVPEYRSMEPVARGARALAMEAGRRGVFSGDRAYDPLKADIRRDLARDEQRVWDLIAPPAGANVPRDEATELAEQLAAAALRVHPALDPRPVLPQLQRRVVLAHGWQDQLVPFTETLRLQEHLPYDVLKHASVTRLFAHSRGAGGMRLLSYPAEALRFARLLQCALALPRSRAGKADPPV